MKLRLKIEPKRKIMKLFPRVASALIFHNPPKSPARENRQVAGRGFSGPVKISTIPKEAQSKSNSSGFETPEPTSPKVSCIGQIKHKKKMKEIARNAAAAAAAKISQPKKRHPPSVIKRILTGGKILGRAKSNHVAAPSRNHRGGGKPPRLNQMKRFSSGRDTLASFDWTAQIVPADLEGEETEGDGRSPVSETVWIGEDVGPLQPRKEVNIWKRRTAVPPTPLQLNSS
ncbi:uncharacterized protein At1g76070-like [Cucurbita pepo subsp. pepo]|uniref:uncharacterized protein At1g76070-like n=1 Tax=Cucurbita pepo subsp. pepo TaxID=3664 RepID=UPI000C9D5F74|nr:uncharacterized protein At1g76070-like [Cucurbita pepo subsp. pepo]